MKKFFSMFFLLFAVLAFSTGCTRVESGYVGVKVNLLGSNKGVESEVVGVGRYFLSPNEEIYLFPTFTQNAVWTADSREGSETDESISFQTKDGVEVNGDFGITYHINPDKVATVFQKYRKGIDEITDVYMRSMVRDALNRESSSLSISSIYGEGKTGLIDRIVANVKAEVEPTGIVVEKIYLVSNLRFPPSVAASIQSKSEATEKAQQRENEIKTAEAQAQIEKTKAEGEAAAILARAKAEAEANLMIARSLTPEMVNYRYIEKWNGEMPKVSGSGTNLMLQADSFLNQATSNNSVPAQ